MKLPPDWSELLTLLCSRRVRFLIVGAHALAVHGRPRATGDLDLFIEPTEVNARRLGAALSDFGSPALGRDALRFAEPDRMATLGREPLRVELLTGISGVSFRQAWHGRVRVRFGRHVVGVLGRREFIMNKRAANRPKDRLDLALLDEAEPPKPRDAARVRRKTARRPQR